MHHIMFLFIFTSLSLLAQGPLQPPPEPVGNPVTPAGANLGKVLFWDEQLSSTRTVACGTCHINEVGGTDPRSLNNASSALNPGPDGVFNTADDITGSPGVPLNLDDGTYSWSMAYGLMNQVTGRKTPSAINAGYSNELFWDGRAEDRMLDPITGEVVLNSGAALESQALGPPLSSAEMAHVNRDWGQVAEQIALSEPLALAENVPSELLTWINDRSYSELFEEAFGTADVTPSRIAMAIASYERTLFSNQTPFDDDRAGNNNALTRQERRGRAVFNRSDCNECHSGVLLTDDDYHYIGVRPADEDEGRFSVTGDNDDLGRFRTPSLRNIELRAPYFHNGRFETLAEVIDFYDRGGDFDAPNKDNRIQPLNLTQGEKDDLLAFLTRPLTDARVANGEAPFDRPTLYTESDRVPVVSGSGVSGSGGFQPLAVAQEPPLIGNPSFTVAVYQTLGSSNAMLVIDDADPGTGAIPATASFARVSTLLSGSGAGQGFGSMSLEIPSDGNLRDTPLFGRWYVDDPEAPGGLAVSDLIQFTPFGNAEAAVLCVGDLNGDGSAGLLDFVRVVNTYGNCNGCDGDLNNDGLVSVDDIHFVAGNWQKVCD